MFQRQKKPTFRSETAMAIITVHFVFESQFSPYRAIRDSAFIG